MKKQTQKNLLIGSAILLIVQITNAQTLTFAGANQVGGIGEDEGLSLALDAAGNLYSIGNFSGTVDFDPGPGIYNLVSAGSHDIFISKFDAFGNFIWAKRIGGTSDDIGYTIDVDATGNVYASGWFDGTADFDPGAGAANLTSHGGSDIFISKLDNLGNYLWAKSIGGAASDQGVEIKIDPSGNILLTGIFSNTVDFDPDTAIVQLISNGGYDIFLLQFDPLGNLAWVIQQGGTYDDDATCLGVNVSGDLFLCTSFQDTVDFNPGLGINNVTSNGGADIAITKFDALGNFIWAKRIGGPLDEKPLAMNIDGSGNILMTGYFEGTADFDPDSSVANLTSAGTDDIFVLKLDPAAQLVWARKIGGNSYDYGMSIATDAAHNVFVTGFFSGIVDVNTTSGNYHLSSAGQMDICIAALDSSGSFKWAAGFGSTLIDGGRDVLVNNAGDIIFTGGFGGIIDFNPDSGIFNLTSMGITDVFYSKMSLTVSGINEKLSINDFIVYPNPTNDVLNIGISNSANIAGLEIYDNRGTLVYKQGNVNSLNTIKLTNQTNGLYLLKIKYKNNSTSTQKIVFQ